MDTNSAYYSGNLFYTVNALHRQISALAEAAFLDLGLTISDAYLILCVNEKHEIQPMEISEKILLAPSTITRMVEKLEKRSIVVRRQEGKYSFITPTTKGKDLYIAIQQKWDEINANIQSKLTLPEINTLIEITNAAADKLRK